MENTSFVEYILRDYTEPLLQGDIFLWKETSDDPWKQFGVIVTADCDLANNKYGDSMSYCPIIRLHDFLKIFWVSKDLKKQQVTLSKEIAQQLTKARKENRPEYTEAVNPSLLSRWLSKRGVDGLLDDIKEPEGRRRNSLRNNLILLQDLITVIDIDDLEKQIFTIARVRTGVTHVPSQQEAINKTLLSVWKQYSEKVPNLQGDLFFLSELSPNHKEGYIVYLRRIAEIYPGDIATNSVMDKQSKATRISHLRSVLKYRITQKLAAVFSDIGLPTEYENMSKDKMKDMASILNINSI